MFGKYTFIFIALFVSAFGAVSLFVGGADFAFAAQEEVFHEAEGVSHGVDVTTFLWIAVILIAAKLASLIAKFGQPTVLGELVMGVILGNLALLGITLFEPIKHDSIIAFLAELGVVILLFQIGLESNIAKLRKVGVSVFLVAAIGVVVPFVAGTYIVGPWLLPGLDPIAYLFLGAALTATSTGITARVFQDLGKLQSSAAQIVLGAAVVDDVIGLIILGVVSVIAVTGAVSLGIIGGIVAKAIFFLVGAIIIGHISAPFLGRFFAKISPSIGMKFSLAISFGLIFAYIGQEFFGLAAIVGAFAAGLVLDSVHFRFFHESQVLEDFREAAKKTNGGLKHKIDDIIDHHSHRHVEDLIEPIVYFFVPIFFVVTGMSVDLRTLFDFQIFLVALAVTAVAFAGKLLSGLAVAKGNRLLVGFGMVPRGEVGLIFASIGAALGVITPDLFSVIVIMVILTTLLTPPVLTFLLKRQSVSLAD